MNPEFTVIRHRKENLKKCSLRGLEKDPRFSFYTYPDDIQCCTPDFFSNMIILDVRGDPVDDVSESMMKRPILIIDATWRYAQKMVDNIPGLQHAHRYKLPENWVTAYPRKQTDCPDPERGLASIEAIYVASLLFKKSCLDALDSYYWKHEFLDKNRVAIELTKY